MSIKTRIRRPTTATPRNLRRERFVHVSTNYGWVHPTDAIGRSILAAPAQFVKLGKGSTYRREVQS